MAYISCFRSGEVVVTRRVPKGAIQLVKGHGRRLKRVLCATARHAYDGVTLLVPGIPEAENDLQALAAAKAFELELYKSLAATPWPARGGGKLP